MEMEIKTENGENGDNEFENKDENKKFRNKRELQKRKERKTITNLKGFGKRGIFGRGTELNDDEGNYFVKISETIREEFDVTDDKTILADNTLESCLENEIKYSSNQVASRIIENLIPFSNEEIFEKFLTEFSKNFRIVCSDPFASHILQKLVEVSFIRAVAKDQIDSHSSGPQHKRMKLEQLSSFDYNLKATFSENHIKICNEFVIKTSNFLLNNLEDFVYDSYGNFLIRSCLGNLTGNCIQKEYRKTNNSQRKFSETFRELTVPNEWHEIVIEYSDRLYYWPQLSDFPYEEFSSGILQHLLIALEKCNKAALKSFTKKIFQHIQEKLVDDELPKIYSTEPSIRLLEILMKVASKKLFNKMFNLLFLNKLIRLSEMSSVNFAVQKLFNNCKDTKIFEIAFMELSPNIENLLKIGHTGVVLSLVTACERLKSNQTGFVKALQTALHCNDSPEKSDLFPLLVLKLKPYEIYIQDKSNFIHIHGSLILQSMLNFNKPIVLINTLLKIKNDTLAATFSTPSGSHVVDAFVKSSTIGEKSREKLIHHMHGTYFDMATSRNGSRVFEALINVANDKQKEKIMEELSERTGLLLGTQMGKIIAFKYRLNIFNSSRTRWRAEFNSKQKIQNMFKDIVDK